MAISLTLIEYLEWEGVDYDLLEHPYSRGSQNKAEQAHITGEQLAKGVVLEDENGYLVAVLPATHQIDLDKIRLVTQRDLRFANEEEISDLFYDCETGAIPPLPEAFGYEGVMDKSLNQCKDVYLEAGDHIELVHLNGDDFRYLMAPFKQDSFSHHV